MALIRQVVSTGPLDRDPGGGAATPTAVPAEPAATAPIASSRPSIRPAHIYYKYEGGSPSGSHKPNTALAQAYYNKAEGVTRLATETGAGQWGSALAFAGRVFGLEVKVYMVRASATTRSRTGGSLMETYGARGRGQPVAGHAVRPQGARARTPTTPARSGSPSARRSRTRSRHPGTRSTRSAPCSTSSCSTRPSSARRRSQQMGMAGEEPDVDHRLRRRRLELRRAVVPVARSLVPWRQASTASSRSSRRRLRA